jgi:hypothetical protein
VVLYDLFTNGQPDAGAFVFAAAVQALENGKDFSGVFFFEPDAVILKFQLQVLVGRAVVIGALLLRRLRSCSGSQCAAASVFAYKLERIGYEVLK